MSKAVKTVVAVAAAIAVPFVAAPIAAAIGLSAAIGATAGAAIVGGALGAGVGAAGAALTGGNVGRGALMGGVSGAIGGGVAGYNAPVAAAPTATAGGALEGVATAYPVDLSSSITATPLAPTASTAGLTNVPFAELGGQFGGVDATGYGFGAPGYGAEGFGDIYGADTYTMTGGEPVMRATDTSMLSSGPQYNEAAFRTAAGLPAEAVSVAAAPTGGVAEAAAARGLPAGASLDVPLPTGMGDGYSPTLLGVTSQPTPPEPSFLSQFGTAIASKFADPRNLADLTLRAAGQLAGSAIAGDGLSSQERELLDQQTEELRQLQQTNQGLFNQKLEQAQALIGESKYFDPEYFGLQRARRAQIAGARAKRAGLRGLTGDRRESEARRYDIATGRETSTAYDVGYGTGVQGRLQTMQAGLSAFPQPMSYGSVSAYGGTPLGNLSAAQSRAGQRAEEIGQYFGGLTGMQQARSRGTLF